MAEVIKDFEFEILDTKKSKTLNHRINDVDSSMEAYSKMRENVRSNTRLSISEFEKRFEVNQRKSYVKFGDKPWSSDTELEKAIRNMNNVKNARYVPPMQDSYGPPSYHVQTSGSIQDLRDEVNDYYDGLTVERSRNGKVRILIDAARVA